MAVAEARVSARATAWAWRQIRERRLRDKSALVLLAAADSADAAMRCARGPLVEATGLTGREVAYAAADLERCGVVVVEDDALRLTATVPRPAAPRKPVPRTVAGRPITPDEQRVAAGIVAAWNERTGQRLTVEAHELLVVRRVRHLHKQVGDRAYEPERHAQLIGRVLDGDAWWTGVPGIHIVYGSDAALDRAIAQAQRKPERSRSERALAELERLKDADR